MFELHLGEDLSVKSADLTSPLLVLGKSGQGKSVFLMNLVLELIKNGQKGYLYDPFGDVARKVTEHLSSPEARVHVKMVSAEDAAPLVENKEGFFLIHGNSMEDGTRKTCETARPLLKSIFAKATEDSWLIIDEAFGVIDEELFDLYLSKPAPKLVLSSTEVVGLSTRERARLFRATETIALYKPREVDAKWLEENYPALNSKSIGAIKQYHFQFLHEGMVKYTAAPWPLPKL
jgi:hypothetical protein